MQRFFRKLQKRLIRFWGKVKKGSPLDIAILGAAVLLAVVSVVIIIVLCLPKKDVTANVPSISVAPDTSAAGDTAYDKDADKIIVTEYDGTLLAESNDAGASYIDETLFIGDSNTARMVQYGPVTLANSLGASSMGIQHVLSTPCINFSGYSSPVYVAKAVEMMQPRRIVINYGTNNTSWDVETFIKQYKAALDAIHKSYEYADIIIASVLPVAKERTYPTITMQKIDAFNKALVELAKQEGYQYLNSTEAIADANTGYARADYMMSDGIHLNGEGMAAYFNYVRTHSYTTEDRRPTLKKVPAHLATPDSFFGPEVPAPESESDSSSTTNSKYSFTLAGADIQIGQTVQLNAAEYKPSAAEFLEKQGTTVTWTSSDTTIATVSGGAVTGVKAGTVEITCTIGKISKKCKVTVKDVPLQLTIGGNLTVVVGTTSQLSVSFSPATYAGAKVATWSSSNTAAATIDPSTGLVKAIAEGKTEIVVSMDGKSTTKTTLTVTAAAHTHAWTEWKVDPAPTCSTKKKKRELVLAELLKRCRCLPQAHISGQLK